MQCIPQCTHNYFASNNNDLSNTIEVDKTYIGGKNKKKPVFKVVEPGISQALMLNLGDQDWGWGILIPYSDLTLLRILNTR